MLLSFRSVMVEAVAKYILKGWICYRPDDGQPAKRVRLSHPGGSTGGVGSSGGVGNHGNNSGGSYHHQGHHGGQMGVLPQQQNYNQQRYN